MVEANAESKASAALCDAITACRITSTNKKRLIERQLGTNVNHGCPVAGGDISRIPRGHVRSEMIYPLDQVATQREADCGVTRNELPKLIGCSQAQARGRWIPLLRIF